MQEAAAKAKAAAAAKKKIPTFQTSDVKPAGTGWDGGLGKSFPQPGSGELPPPSNVGMIDAPAGTTPPPTGTMPTLPGETPSIYTPEYYDQVRDKYMSQLTGSEAQEKARQRRSSLAGAGVLGGTAFDRGQEQYVGEVRRGADTAVRESMLEGAEWERGAPEREMKLIDDQLAILGPIATQPGADPQVVNIYNKLMGKRFGIEPTTSETPAPPPSERLPGHEPPPQPGLELIDFTPPVSRVDKTIANIEDKMPEIATAAKDYGYISDNIPGWVTDNKQNTPAAKAWRRYDELARTIQAIQEGSPVSISSEELAEFNTLSDAFTRYIAAGGDKLTDDPAFLPYGDPLREFKTGGGTLYY